MNPYPILIVEDDESQRRIIEYNLKQKGYRTTAVESAEMALKELQKSEYYLLVSDMKLPGMSGTELLSGVKELRPEMPVVFITAFGTIEKAVEAMKLGAYDYITKPFDRDEFLLTIEKALEYRRLKDENLKLRSELDGKQAFSDMIGSSPAMLEIFETIKKVSGSDATILISGESGTGKELVARGIHGASERASKQLVTVNCAAIPKDLLESELFGHVTGAFTGAVKDKMGKFVLADGGTIFLDEIGDLHLELQAKLLRVLQEKLVEPLGSNETIPVDIRVIAASNQNLAARVKEGRFREDLYYRLNVIPITIPPLRERPEDIPLLAEHFTKTLSQDNDVAVDKKAMALLKLYHWPGNVRELENAIKRALVLKRGSMITIRDLPPEITGENVPRPSEDGSGKPGNHSLLIDSEIKLITEALKTSGWNQSKAAARLGIPRHVLIYRMRKYNIREP